MLWIDLKPWGPFDCPKCLHDVVDHDGIQMSNCFSSPPSITTENDKHQAVGDKVASRSASRCRLFTPKVPDWVLYNLAHPYKMEIEWQKEAEEALATLLCHSTFYGTQSKLQNKADKDADKDPSSDLQCKCPDEGEEEKQEFVKLKRAIDQVLSLDIRSLHRGKGGDPQSTTNLSSSTSISAPAASPALSSDLVAERVSMGLEEAEEQAYEVEYDVFHVSFLIKKTAVAAPSASTGGEKRVWILVQFVCLLSDDVKVP